MDKNTRKKIYKNALEIVNVVNDTDKIFRSMGVNLEFDDESTIIGRTMDVLFSNPKNIVCDALGLQLKQEDGHYKHSEFEITLCVMYPESQNPQYSLLEEEMLSIIDLAADDEELAEKMWLCFTEENIEAREWIKKKYKIISFGTTETEDTGSVSKEN